MVDVLWELPLAMLLMGYVLGSIPFGVILTRMAGAGDLRSIGSGNIGATNVLRTGNKGLAAATLLLDLLKGAAAVWIAQSLSPGDAVLSGLGAFFGHLYPVWLKFHGGKGVATLMGIVLAFDWRFGLVYAVIWLGLLALLRISSVAGMVAALSAPVAAVALGRGEYVAATVAMALIVLWKHRENIGRLLAGTEPKIGGKAKAESVND